MYIMDYDQVDDSVYEDTQDTIFRCGGKVCSSISSFSNEIRELHNKNKNMIAQLVRKDNLIKTLREVSPLLLEDITLDNILDAIVKSAVTCFGCYRGVVYLWDKNGMNLVCHGTAGISEASEKIIRSKPLNAKRHNCIEIRAAQSSTYTLVKDPMRGADLTDLDIKISTQHGGRGPVLYLPLRSKGKTFGIIGVECHPTHSEIAEEDIRSLMLFANQASVAIEIARLYEQNERKIKYLIRLQEIYEMLNDIKDTDRLIETILNCAIEISQAKSGIMWRCNADTGTVEASCFLGDPDLWKKESFSLDDYPFRELGKECEFLVIENNGQNALGLPDKYAGYTILLFPVLCKDVTEDILQLMYPGNSVVDDIEFEVLKLLISRAGKVLENVQLYNRLAAENRLIDNVINSIGIGFLITDKQGTILSANPKLGDIIGIPIWQMVGSNIDSIMGGDLAELRDTIQDTITNLTSNECEIQGTVKNNELTLKVHVFVVYDGEDRFSAVVTLIQDITDRKKLNDSLRRMEKMAAVGTMAAGLAHEIRNPLSGIYTTLQMLARELRLTEDQQQEMDAVLEEIDRMETLMKEVLQFSKPMGLKRERVDIREVLESCIGALQDKLNGNRVVWKRPEEALYVSVDRDKIRRVFLNLLMNAVEASDSGGVVEIHVLRRKDAPHVETLIVDHGVGIPQENVSKIFDPFFSTKNYGTGLGLSISQKIVEEHGGSITLEPSDSNDTIFKVALEACD